MYSQKPFPRPLFSRSQKNRAETLFQAHPPPFSLYLTQRVLVVRGNVSFFAAPPPSPKPELEPNKPILCPTPAIIGRKLLGFFCDDYLPLVCPSLRLVIPQVNPRFNTRQEMRVYIYYKRTMGGTQKTKQQI
jgi:hypothetical protein